MNPVFDVSISRKDRHGRETNLTLPATPYEMQDALERLRVNSDTEIKTEILYSYSSKNLNFLPTAQGGLYEVNALAEKLASLENYQSEAFEGLLKKESFKSDQPIPISKLIDLAYSTDCCHVLTGITTDRELGEFLVENDLWGNGEPLPEEAYEKLDYVSIGREHRLAEGGTFTSSSYIEQHSELIQAHQTLDPTPETPDYIILLEGENGGVLLKLPVNETKLDAVGVRETGFTCIDCKAPMLTDLVNTAENIREVNRLAVTLSEMPQKQFTEYKAILAATKCSEFEIAVQLLNKMDEYIVTQEYETLEDVARDEMSVIMSPDSVEIMLPYLDLEGYGHALVEALHADLTAYGMVERKDRQPVYMPQEQSQQGGMEMA